MRLLAFSSLQRQTSREESCSCQRLLQAIAKEHRKVFSSWLQHSITVKGEYFVGTLYRCVHFTRYLRSINSCGSYLKNKKFFTLRGSSDVNGTNLCIRNVAADEIPRMPKKPGGPSEHSVKCNKFRSNRSPSLQNLNENVIADLVHHAHRRRGDASVQ